jgi:hypothetical protein
MSAFSALPGLPTRIPAPKRGRKPQNIEHRISNTEISALPAQPPSKKKLL